MTDWASLEAIQSEWPRSQLDASADLVAWREGNVIYEGNDDYGSMIRSGGLLCCALRHHLYGDGLLVGKDLPETTHRVLFSSCFPPPDQQSFPMSVAAQVRLALAIVKKHGWQPREWGGDGLLGDFIEKSIMIMTAAVAPVPGRSWEGDLKGFFTTKPFHIPDAPSDPSDSWQAAPSQPVGRTHVADDVRDPDAVLNSISRSIDDAKSGDIAAQARVRAFAHTQNGDLHAAFAEYESAGQLGDVDSMYDAGCTASDLGLSAQASYWWQAAAAAGRANAMYNLGSSTYNAGDVPGALDWWERAGAAGDSAGYAALTQHAIEMGDAESEFRWSRLGADGGHPFCMLRHGDLLMRRYPGDRETFTKQALPLLEQLAAEGNTEAMFYIGLGYGGLSDMGQARLWLKRAEAAGDEEATRVLRKYGLE